MALTPKAVTPSGPRTLRKPGPSPRSSSVATAYPSPSLDAIATTDHVEHDLVGARADAVQAHVPPAALAAVLLHVAGAAVDLDALVGHLDGDARGVQLGHGDLADRVLAVVMAPGGGVDHLACALDLGGHLGELVAYDLELAD